MRNEALKFLRRLVEAPSPSGYEQPAANVFREYVRDFADDVSTDVMGSVHARVKGTCGAPPVMLAGHMDEIGFLVNYITSEGYLTLKPVGGIDSHLLPGKRVHVHTRKGPILGVLGRMPIHLLEEDERKQVVKLHKMFVDLGMPADDVKKRVRVGDAVTFSTGFEKLGKSMAVSRGFDDKVGAWVAAEVVRRVREAGGAPGDVIAVATAQEEVGLRGGIASAYSVDAAVGIAVEVGHATDYPDVDKRRHGDIRCGSGPIIARGANINPVVFERLVQAAEADKIPYQVDAEPRATGTDANPMQIARGGKAVGLVSVPLRYMHTPTEVLSLEDLERTAALVTGFVMRLDDGVDFTP